MELRNIILTEVTQTLKNTHGMYSLISGYLPKTWNTYFTDHMKPKKKTNMWMLHSYSEGRTKYSWEEIQGQRVERDLRQGHPETALTRDSSHRHPPNPVTMADAKMCLLRGARHGCLLRGCYTAVLIQMRMVAANHWTEQVDSNRGV